MKHADKLINRILMLDGLPNLQDLGKLLVGENAVEILDCDLQAEQGAQRVLKGVLTGLTKSNSLSKPVNTLQ